MTAGADLETYIQEASTDQERTFDIEPGRIAYYETNVWRAYYERRWPRLLRLIVAVCQEQFHIPFPFSLQAAYYSTRAAIAWVPADHDENVVRAYYRKFYRLARGYSGLEFDPERAAALETRYNDVHRRSVFKEDKTEFIDTMVDLHCELFGLAPEQARESAELRVRAAEVVDLLSNHVSLDVSGDWLRIEDYLRRCYESIRREMAANREGAMEGLTEPIATRDLPRPPSM